MIADSDQQDDDPQDDKRGSGEGIHRRQPGVGLDVHLAGDRDLPQEKTEAGDDEAEAHERQAGSHLGYFMSRKVMCGKETMQAAGTVTKKLAKWLAEKGYIKDTEYEQERASAAAKDLPNAVEVLDLLFAYCDEHAPARHGGEIEDHFLIEKVEPGKLWLNPLTASSSVIGPIPVPKKVTALCEPGWGIGGVVAKVGKGWRLVEVWNVTP